MGQNEEAGIDFRRDGLDGVSCLVLGRLLEAAVHIADWSAFALPNARGRLMIISLDLGRRPEVGREGH